MTLGSLCLAGFLIIFGLITAFGWNFQYREFVVGGLAVIAGLLFLFGGGVVVWRRP